MNKKEFLKNFTKKIEEDSFPLYEEIVYEELEEFIVYYREKIMTNPQLKSEYENTIEDIFATMEKSNITKDDWEWNMLDFLLFTYNELYGRFQEIEECYRNYYLNKKDYYLN